MLIPDMGAHVTEEIAGVFFIRLKCQQAVHEALLFCGFTALRIYQFKCQADVPDEEIGRCLFK